MLLLLAGGPAPGQNASGPVRRALLVGINEYQHPSLESLKFAVRDVADLAIVLKQGGYEVTLLSDDSGQQDPNLAPTKANIERELAALKNRCQRGDTFLLALAGHGVQFGTNAFFCPQDGRPFESEGATLISVTKIYDSLESSFAGTKLVLIDACRNDPTPGRGRGIDADGAPPPRGVGVLFSCARGQRAYEPDALRHGVFFHFVLEGLRGQAKNAKGAVTFEGLSLFVREHVPLRLQELMPGTEQEPNLKADLVGIPIVLDQAVAMTSSPSVNEPLTTAAKTTSPNGASKSPTPNAGNNTPAVKNPIQEPVAKINDTFTNSLQMTFKFIPPGQFQMGSPGTERERKPDEILRTVRISKGFFLGIYEVTQQEYYWVLNQNPSSFSSTGRDAAQVRGMDTWKNPVDFVSWNDAQRFVRALSNREAERKSGRTYRLPTEAEWEYAARAGEQSIFSFGNVSYSGVANWKGSEPYGIPQPSKFLGRTTPVGSYPPNKFGLYDMHGNISEWCQDSYSQYQTGFVTDPRGAASGFAYPQRGGSWNCPPKNCRLSHRYAGSPDEHYNSAGFRVVVEGVPVPKQ